VDVADAGDRCRNVPNRDRDLRARQDAQRAAARNRDAKAYRESDADGVQYIIGLNPTD
jgi:hypothetical protein